MVDPILSVIIATRHRAEPLARCLASLAGQTHPRDRWEVIVVHDGEEKPADDRATCFAIKRLQQAHAGCGIARNTGAAEAHGQYLIFTDDDCLFPPDWLSRFEAGFLANPGCMIAGIAQNWLSTNAYSQATQAMTEALLEYSNREPAGAQVALGNNLGVPARDFHKLGGFSPRYFRNAAEDRDFSARWLREGRRIVSDPGIVVFHAHELNLRSFLEQHYNYGRGSYVYHRAQAERHQRRWQPLGFYISMMSRAPSMRVRMLLVLSQLAHTMGFARSFMPSSVQK